MLYIVRNRILINRPIEVVFAFVTDPMTTHQWRTNLLSAEVFTPGPMGVGTRVKETWQAGKTRKQAIWEITTYEPPIKRNHTYIGESRPFRQTGSLLFTFVQDKTLLQSTITIETHFPFTLLLPILRHNLRAQNKRDFARLKQVLEVERA